MSHYALVVVDAEKAHRARLHQMGPHVLYPHEHGLEEEERLRRIHRRVGRSLDVQVNDLWTSVDRECPMGQPNCEHCGDPEHGDQCRAAGHCEGCGTRHGIAPLRRLREIGVALIEVPDEHLSSHEPGHRVPRSGLAWHGASRSFRPPIPEGSPA